MYSIKYYCWGGPGQTRSQWSLVVAVYYPCITHTNIPYIERDRLLFPRHIGSLFVFYLHTMYTMD